MSNNNTNNMEPLLLEDFINQQQYFYDNEIIEDVNYDTFIKPIGSLSQDLLLYHENDAAAALTTTKTTTILPIGESKILSINHYDLNSTPTLIQTNINPFMLHHNIFLVQPNTNNIITDHDDNSSQYSSTISSMTNDDEAEETNHINLLDIFGTDIIYDFQPQPQQQVVKKRKLEQDPVKQKRRKKTKTAIVASPPATEAKENQQVDHQFIEPIMKQANKTVFQELTQLGIDWCRYCGTTEGVNWRPGPWGKRTLCNKHGCDYKGYGLASRLPRLDLSLFNHEKLKERTRPVIQLFCIVCQSPESSLDNPLILCHGACSRAYHQQCHNPAIKVRPSTDSVHWYCNTSCKENMKKHKVVVELPRKHMPMMHLLSKSIINNTKS